MQRSAAGMNFPVLELCADYDLMMIRSKCVLCAVHNVCIVSKSVFRQSTKSALFWLALCFGIHAARRAAS